MGIVQKNCLKLLDKCMTKKMSVDMIVQVANIIEDCYDEKLNEDNIVNTKLTLNYKEDDYEKKLKDLFLFIITNLSEIYEKKKESL